MSFCPLDAQTGFVELTGPINQLRLTQIQAISAPFTASFSPRQEKPYKYDSYIYDGTNNTLLYNSIRYQLATAVQICKPTHKGYILPGMSDAHVHEMEIVLTYINTNAGGSYPAGILVILPIYSAQSGSSQRANYLQQFLGDGYPTATLQSLFGTGEQLDPDMKAMSYMSCIDIVNNQNRNKTLLRCFYFPRGIELAPSEYESFKAMVTVSGRAPLPDFRLIPVLRYDTGKTVLSYTIGDKGVKIPRELSDTGEIATKQISITSLEFRTKFQYFTKPIRVTGKSGEDTCPYYPTSKYKCVPFNTLRDLSGNQVIPGGTGLDKVIASQDEAQSAMTPPAPEISSITRLLIITFSILGGLILLAGLVYLFKWAGSSGKTGSGREGPVGTAAALAVGAIPAVTTVAKAGTPAKPLANAQNPLKPSMPVRGTPPGRSALLSGATQAVNTGTGTGLLPLTVAPGSTKSS